MSVSNLDNILSLGVIPRPKKPADIDSFLWPLIQELLKLSEGVQALTLWSLMLTGRSFLFVHFSLWYLATSQLSRCLCI